MLFVVLLFVVYLYAFLSFLVCTFLWLVLFLELYSMSNALFYKVPFFFVVLHCSRNAHFEAHYNRRNALLVKMVHLILGQCSKSI